MPRHALDAQVGGCSNRLFGRLTPNTVIPPRTHWTFPNCAPASPPPGRRERVAIEPTVPAARAPVLRSRGALSCRSGPRRASGRQVSGGCSVRIAVSLRGAARLARRGRPGPVRNRPVHSGFRLFFHPAGAFAHRGIRGGVADRAFRDHGPSRGVDQCGAKAHGGIAPAHAR